MYGARHAEDADDGRPIIRETHANTVAALHAVLSEGVRKAIRRVFDLGVSVALRPADERDFVRASRNAGVKKILY